MKDQIISLLAGERFKDYLQGMQLLEDNIGTENLPDSVLDQEIIERACAVLILEKWAQHDDYFAELEHFVEKLPAYEYLLSDKDLSHFLRGLVLFINGIGQQEYDISGFIYPSHSGWIMSSSAAERIAEHFESKNESENAAFFRSLEEFFSKINSAQFGIISRMMDIKKWNSSMANGFYNIMTSSDLSTQYWMLGSLYKVVNDPVVKNEIFGRYLEVLYRVRDKYQAEGNSKHADEVNAIISNVESKSRGE